jgi:hypothetical protein
MVRTVSDRRDRAAGLVAVTGADDEVVPSAASPARSASTCAVNSWRKKAVRRAKTLVCSAASARRSSASA